MSYSGSVPIISDPYLQSAGQIRSNYKAINLAFSDNHTALTGTSPQGMHNVMTLQSQGGDPTTSASEIAIYNKVVSSAPNLFFMPNSAQTPIQMTYPSVTTGLQSSNPDVYLPRQYSFVAGPFIIYVGTLTYSVGLIVTLSPASTLLYVSLSALNPKKPVFSDIATLIPSDINMGGANFTVNAVVHYGGTFSYIAIGKP